MYVYMSSRTHGRKCECVEIKEAHVDEICTSVEEDWFHLCFLPAQSQPASDLGAAENVIMDPVEAEQNCRRSLRNNRESARKRKWQTSQETN